MNSGSSIETENILQPTVFISIGSNIDPHNHLIGAHQTLSDLLGNAVISPIYQSPAVGMKGNDFLNAVISGVTKKTLSDLMQTLSQIECKAGRVRTADKFSDRTLDLDLLLYGDRVCTQTINNTSGQKTVTLPHPEILTEAHVLQPLADIAGDFIHPAVGVNIADLLLKLKQESPQKFLSLQQINLDIPE